MVILFVKFRSAMSDREVRAKFEERAPRFRAIPELVQKYYAHEPSTGEWVGMYLWDSAEGLAKFRQSDLARTIASAYQVIGEPRIEVLDVLFPLRAAVPETSGVPG